METSGNGPHAHHGTARGATDRAAVCEDTAHRSSVRLIDALDMLNINGEGEGACRPRLVVLLAAQMQLRVAFEQPSLSFCTCALAKFTCVLVDTTTY